MTILSLIAFGIVVGLFARALLPGQHPMSALATMAVGAAGSLVGGVVANVASGSGLFDLHALAVLGALAGAVALLVTMQTATRLSSVSV